MKDPVERLATRIAWHRSRDKKYQAVIRRLEGLDVPKEILAAMKQAVQASYDIGWLVGKAKAEGKLQ